MAISGSPMNTGFISKAALAVAATLAVAGCSEVAVPLSGPKTGVVAKDTPVELMLLRELESGRTPTGSKAPFLVLEDVKTDTGIVAIPKGSVVYGEVTWSRGEDALSVVANRPARLAVRLGEVTAVDGQKIALRADDDAEFQFDRANTGRVNLAETLSEAWDNEEDRKLLIELRDFVETGKAPSFDPNAKSEDLASLSARLRLDGIKKLAEEGRIDEVARLMDDVKSGRDRVSLVGGDPVTTLLMMSDLGQLAGGVTDRLSRMLKGRSIRAHVGTKVEAFVAESATVSAP